jgi:hypothetical protein
MTGHFSSARTLCLHNENAQCNPIWLAQTDGLKRAHFRTSGSDVSRSDEPAFEACYESCERACVQVGHPPKNAQV